MKNIGQAFGLVVGLMLVGVFDWLIGFFLSRFVGQWGLIAVPVLEATGLFFIWRATGRIWLSVLLAAILCLPIVVALDLYAQDASWYSLLLYARLPLLFFAFVLSVVKERRTIWMFVLAAGLTFLAVAPLVSGGSLTSF